MGGRVFILGIDGGEFRVIDYLAAAGRLPNLAALMKQGLRRPLLSSTPPLTPAAWVSFYTGTNPGRHGVVDFLARREGSYRLAPVHRSSAAGLTLWQAAARGGLKSLVVNLPVTYPPEPIDGWMVSGMDTPSAENEYTHPVDLKREILSLHPDYRPDVHVSRGRLRRQEGLREWYAREVLALERSRMDLVEHLATDRPWGLAIAVLVAVDRLQHVFWREVEEAMAAGEVPEPPHPAGEVFRAYRDVDDFIPRLLGLLGPEDHLMILSDHGFGPLEKDVNLNVLLARLGYLAFREEPRGARLRREASAGLKAALPSALRDLLWKVLPAPRAKRLEGLDSLERMVDWPRTRAYALGYLGGIYLNLAGREPAGTVPPAGREETLRELESALAAFRDPEDGKPLVTESLRREAVYRGERLGPLPDLVLTLKDHLCTTRHSIGPAGDRLFSRPQEDFGPLSHTGNHRPEGIFIGRGPRLDRAAAPSKPGIMDLFPTALELLGLPPVPGDGRSLLSGTAGPPGEERPAAAPPPPASALSEREESAILDNLRDLGYF